MDKELWSRICLLGRQAKEGRLGAEVKIEAKRPVLTGIPGLLRTIRDFYKVKPVKKEFMEAEEKQKQILHLFIQLIIIVYRDAKRKDPRVSNALLKSFIQDYPGVPGSCLYSQWEALVRAILAWKVAGSTEPLVVWQQCQIVHQAFNEFLNKLLGYLTVGWRCAEGKNYDPSKVFSTFYGVRLNQFRELTGGEGGAFYLLFRLANPQLRNAIAHGDVWLDEGSGVVHYKDGKGELKDYEIDLLTFVGHAGLVSNVPHAFITALALIGVMEHGGPNSMKQIPPPLLKLFHFKRTQAANSPG